MSHIAHLTTVHRPFDTRVFQKECRSLAQAGYRVTLLAPHAMREVVDGVEILPVPRFKRRLARMTWGTWAAYLFARSQYADLYHFHDPELLPVGILLELTTPAPVIYDVHENHPHKIWAREWLPNPLRRIASGSVRGLEGIAAVLLHGFVAATENIAVRFPPTKTRVVKNYPLLSMMDLASATRREHAGNYTLIYTGGLTNHRGITQIVQAMDYVNTTGARLTLLGRVIDQRTANEVRGMTGYERVDYYGHVSYTTMYGYLNAAAVGLVCNQPKHDYQLAQPNKLFEYMSAGLPVIASDFPLWREIVEGNACGVVVDPTDPRKIGEAIDYLLDRPDMRETMGENARNAVRERYNWQRESQKLLDLYREVIG
jgi:glycosyltransferase involved in cell wall biosynthesis